MARKPGIIATRIVATIAFALSCHYAVAAEADQGRVDSLDHARVASLSIRQLLLETLSVSRDLKEHGKYHCTYDPSVGPTACDHMLTTSGQYEDFYQSSTTSCEKSELCDGANLGTATWDYIVGSQRICKHLTTGSCTKEALSAQDIRRELLDLLEFKRKLNH
jgi:hypothetical protein